jgi:FkbM family methyltransferase
MIPALKKFLLSIRDYFKYQKSYSQDGEDVVLAAYYHGKKRYKGFYVDVGAHHPVRFSNTWMFYRRGWRGINIDPTPGSMRPFRFLRRRDVNLEIGIGGQPTQLTFYCFDEPALNTFDEAVARQRDTGKPYRVIKTVSVPVEPLAAVLDKHLPAGQAIDFFTIDVEGLDLEVLKSNDWSKYKPEFVLVEDSDFKPGQAAESAIYKFLKSQDYEMAAALKRTIVYRRL